MKKVHQNSFKIVLSLLLVVLMMLPINMVSLLASAATTTPANVAKVGNTEYATIDEAITNWTKGTTLTLLSNVTLSDVVTLKSTEHHILNLGSYTMTAASGKNAIEIQACGTGNAEQYAITIKADATNPGGINAGSKSVIYYDYSKGQTTGNDRPIIKIEGGVFAGATSAFGTTAGIYFKGTEARKAATLNISGGTFNCSINGTGKSKLLISGGKFNYSVGSQGDSTALRLISGGTFKTFGFMTADTNNTKFWFGTKMGVSDVGLYVNNDGYLVVGGPVITELSSKYPAVASNYSKWSNLIKYSSAVNGLYYTNADLAIKKHGEAYVTVYEKPAIVIPENVVGDPAVVEEIKNNTALKDYTPENLPSGAELVIELKSVEDKIVYDVTPMADGTKVELTKGITFRLPIPASVTDTHAKVYHDGETSAMGCYAIKGDGNGKYIEIYSKDFSEYAVETLTPDKGCKVEIYNADGTPGWYFTDESEGGYSIKEAIEWARMIGSLTADLEYPVTYVVEMYEDSAESESFEIGSDVVINGNGHKIVLGDGVTLTNNGTLNDVVVEEPAAPVKIGTQGYATLAEALAAAATMTGDVKVEIFDKVTLASPINGSFDSITFVGKDTDAEIYIDLQGYVEAAGKEVAFNDLILSKVAGGYIGNAGFMNLAFGIFNSKKVTYTNCTFANGAYASSGEVIFDGCTFYRSHDRYGMWAYGDADILVDGCTFADIRGIKMYAEGMLKTGNLTVKNTDFSAADQKPAIVLTSGESVTLDDTNTYSSKGVFELDLDGVPNGTIVNAPANITCVNDNGACGVIVDGKIYTTVAQAAAVATSGSTVTLLHNSSETVELAEGVSLNKNGFEAAGVTVKTPAYVAQVGSEKFESVLEALDYAIKTGASELKLLADSREVMPTDIEIILDADLTITADAPVSAKFYNNGTAYDFVIGSNNNNTLTIGENVTFQLEDRVIWAGYYGNNVDVVIEGTLAGYQYWHGADTTVTSTGTLKTTGEALVMRRGATLNVDGGKVEASYFNILAGNIFAENGADIKCGAFWIDNTGSYAGEGAVSVNIWDSTLTSSGNLKSTSTHAAGVSIDIYDSTVTFADFDGYGASVLDANTTLWVNGESSELTVKSLVNNGTVEIYDAGSMIATGTVTNNNVFTVEPGSSFEGNYVNNAKVYVAEVNGVKYETLAEAIAAAQAGDEIILLADVDGNLVLPANVILNGNGKQITGTLYLMGNVTLSGHVKANAFDFENVGTEINIPVGATLELTGTGRMIIGHGCTFNITGTITDAKTADKATITPSLIMPGATFTGAGVTFNVTNAYIKTTASYCSSSKSASGTFDFNINNSIWEQFGKLAFEAQSTAATVNFELKDSVLTTTSHLVFGVSSGEIVIDNSNVNVGKSNQIENRSTMIIKNGSVVNGAVATSSNAINPGTVIVENATYAVTGQFSGATVGTGTLIIKKGATVSVGSIIDKANIVIDATGMQAGDEINLTANLAKFAGTIEVVNNDKLEAKIVDGKIVLAVKPVAKIGDTKYETLADAIAAAQNGDTVKLLADVELSNRIYIAGKDITLDLAGHVISGVCNSSQSTLVYVENGAKLTLKDSSENETGKITYAQGTSNVGWTVDVKGEFVLESGTIELTGSWNIGYAVDVRPNSWGSEYKEGTTFTMNGGNIISSDGGVRVASSSSSAHKDVSASFVMNGGKIDASWDGVFIQQSDAIYDDLSFTINGGTIESDLNPVRVYGPAPTDYVNDQECMSITLAGGTMTYTGTDTQTWIIDGILRAGGGSSVETILENGNVAVSAAVAQSATAPEGYKWTENTDGTFSLSECDYVAEVNGTKYETLADAIAAAQAGDTITLLTDIVLNKTLVIAADDEIVLDLNGKTISMVMAENATANHCMIHNKGNLTIQGEGKISYKYTGASLGTTYSANTITSDYGSVLTVKSGTIENLTYDSAIIAYAIDGTTNNNGGDVTVIIEGGTITSERQAIRIFANSTTATGTLKISGGEITGRVIIQNANDKANKAALEITGGTFNTNGYKSDVLYVGGSKGATIDMAPVVSGGTFNGEITSSMSVGFIKGGTFDTDVSDFCADGFGCEQNADGTYGVYTTVFEDLWEIGKSNVVLTDNFKMSFAFLKKFETSWNGYYAEIYKGNDSSNAVKIPISEWSSTTISGEAYYVIDYAGIVAKEIGDTISVTIYDAEGNQVSKTRVDGIKEYVMKKLKSTTDSDVELRALLVDILNYGSEAQIKFNHNPDVLANKDLTEEQRGYASEAQVYEKNFQKVWAEGYEDKIIIRSNVVIDNNIRLLFGFDISDTIELSENAKAVVTYTDHSGKQITKEFAISESYKTEIVIVTIDSFSALDSKSEVTCTIVDGETFIASGTNSIASYVGGVTDEATLKVASAMMKYCESAYNYFYRNK